MTRIKNYDTILKEYEENIKDAERHKTLDYFIDKYNLKVPKSRSKGNNLKQKKENILKMLKGEDINTISKEIMELNNENLKLGLKWALCPKNLENNLTNTTNEKNLKKSNKIEKDLGNKIINKEFCKQWTTKLSETLVFTILKLMKKNPKRPIKKNSLLPDWETDDCIYEVKSRSWTTPGTAGEKVLGTMYKYCEIPELYNKPLKIICIAYQEYELTYSKTKIFGTVSKRHKQYLDLAKSQQVEYVKFSDFIKSVENISDYLDESTLNWFCNVNKKDSPKVEVSELNVSEE